MAKSRIRFQTEGGGTLTLTVGSGVGESHTEVILPVKGGTVPTTETLKEAFGEVLLIQSPVEPENPIAGSTWFNTDTRELLRFVGGEWISDSGKESYTNPNPTPTAIGGIPAGTKFDNVSLVEIIEKLLYPYQVPAFTAFTMDGRTKETYEVGFEVPAQDRLFKWTINNAENIKPGTLKLLNDPLAEPDRQKTLHVSPEVKTAPANILYTIELKDIKDTTIRRTVEINWEYKRYFGVSANPDITDEEILTLGSELSTSKNKALTYDATGGAYFYYAYPSSFGDCENIKIYDLPWNDFVLVKRGVANANGIEVPLNIYRSANLINGEAEVNWG